MSRISNNLVNELQKIRGLCVETDVLLSKISSWKVGGKARIIVRPFNIQQIIDLTVLLEKNNIPSLVIGQTTNLLFSSGNIDAVLIQIGKNFSSIDAESGYIKAQSGVWVPRLARFAMQMGLTGIEHTCGIPGTLGGLVVMNGGSQRKGIGDHISNVKTIDNRGNINNYSKEECSFSYRSSIFQTRKEKIVEVELKLPYAVSKKNVHTEMLSILRSRSEKFPRKLPNCGSVFVSNPEMYKKFGPPGKIIEDCGLKGLTHGNAQISMNHANFIVNKGNASDEDVLYLINYARDKVFSETGYLMKVETKFITKLGMIKDI